MKLVVEYLHDAVRLEHLAASEPNPEVSGALKQQAAVYRRMAEERAKKMGLPPPDMLPPDVPQDQC